MPALEDMTSKPRVFGEHRPPARGVPAHAARRWKCSRRGAMNTAIAIADRQHGSEPCLAAGLAVSQFGLYAVTTHQPALTRISENRHGVFSEDWDDIRLYQNSKMGGCYERALLHTRTIHSAMASAAACYRKPSAGCKVDLSMIWQSLLSVNHRMYRGLL